MGWGVGDAVVMRWDGGLGGWGVVGRVRVPGVNLNAGFYAGISKGQVVVRVQCGLG